MFIEKIKSEGLSHLSYVIGDGSEAAVIDPRRDCEVYIRCARERGMRITHIFETHRNEDLISGSPILSAMTGAPVHHGPNPDRPVTYAETVREGDCFAMGDLKIAVLETPGHTYDHVAYVMTDRNYDDGPIGVFTGDALFVGDVGRTDFYPDRAEEVAGLLYDSLKKLTKLGDQALIYPAHGAGSVCGSGVATREFSTIGHERRNNPRLQIDDRDAFIHAKLAESHYYPPYFKTMERLNVEGASAADLLPVPRPITAAEIEKGAFDRIIDVRSITSFMGAHWPGSLALPVAMLSSFAGWFLTEDDRLSLVADDPAQGERAARFLSRIGFDRVVGVFTGVVGAAAAGREFATLEAVDHETVANRLNERAADWTLLDVRSLEERQEKHIEPSRHIYVGELAGRIDELDSKKAYTVMCASGARATIAAAFLKANSFAKVDIFLGSMGAWTAHHDSR